MIDGVLVIVDDIDAHYEQAKSEGATIPSEPESGFLGGAIAQRSSKVTAGCSSSEVDNIMEQSRTARVPRGLALRCSTGGSRRARGTRAVPGCSSVP